ncbi:DUF6198 family protein [uncultured Oscillibacter sp.]|uniref:YczE/YyaS/YitT family protein n=1 Tax=uncultured Oscillibacter sp. TaxID=876091 RepID=UPI00280C0BFA|nr:DUF6198 family protein [uncultured Oscillibacter sp.]
MDPQVFIFHRRAVCQLAWHQSDHPGRIGTSPISSIPYTLSIGFPLSLGMFTLFYSLLLIVIQLVILGRRFPRQFWLQLPVSLGFSLFIDLSMGSLWFLSPEPYPVKLICLLVGCLVLGVGVFMEMAASVVMLPGECTIKAISSTWNKDFGKTKVAVDLTMALSAAALGFFLYGALTGVREGTLISALLVGLIARWINQHLGSRAQALLSVDASASPAI